MDAFLEGHPFISWRDKSIGDFLTTESDGLGKSRIVFEVDSGIFIIHNHQDPCGNIVDDDHHAGKWAITIK